MRGHGHRGQGARVRHHPGPRAQRDRARRDLVRGPAVDLPAARRHPRPGRPGAPPARRHRHRDPRRGPARPRLGDRRRHGLPHRARRAATRPDPRGDQDRRVRRGVLHLVVHGAQPRRDRGQAGRPHDRGLHRPADGRDRPRVRAAGGRAARRGPRAGAWSTRSPRTPPACAPRAHCPRRGRRRPAAARTGTE